MSHSPAPETTPETAPETGICHVSGKSFARARLVPWSAVRPGIGALIEAEVPGWTEGRMISRPELDRFRRLYVERLLQAERGALTAQDRAVIDSIGTEQILSRPADDDPPASFGERAADLVASFGGSWAFILLFIAVLAGWITLNVSGLMRAPFDPYPFILLNLVLSCVAALQAPVIMMSQRRQETKDRLRSQNDYQVNLKAELEIRQLHEKLDHQLAQHWQKLVELQQIQIDLLEDRLHGR